MRRGPSRPHAVTFRNVRQVLQARCKRVCKTGATWVARSTLRVLGNVEVRRGTEPVAIGGPKPRQILAMLVAAHGGVVSTDRLAEELWGDEQPADPGAVLQSNISRLRKLLHPEARIVARPPGYSLEIEPSAVDAWRFEATQLAARPDVAPAAVIEANERALACFSGPPYAEFSDREWARGAVSRLEELRTVAREEVLSAAPRTRRGPHDRRRSGSAGVGASAAGATVARTCRRPAPQRPVARCAPPDRDVPQHPARGVGARPTDVDPRSRSEDPRFRPRPARHPGAADRTSRRVACRPR